MIFVSKPYLPPIDNYQLLLKTIWENQWVTNEGPLVKKLEEQLAEYLDVAYVHFVCNGATAIQLSIKSANVTGEVITTAFSHVSTINTILWMNCTPVVVDINKTTFCIDPLLIEKAITDKTSAIIATHVFGNPCDVIKIEKIAKKYNLKVIYDAAHAFAVKLNNRSVFYYGDVSAVSFHATKLFHTIEGGAVVTNDESISKQCRLMRNFGLEDYNPAIVGINGKNSEFHAAMGLCTLPDVSQFIHVRKTLSDSYKKRLSKIELQYPELAVNTEYNYAYFPVVFSSESLLLHIIAALKKEGICPRRYFYPSLSNLPYFTANNCFQTEDIASRILCLPLYYELSLDTVAFICDIMVMACASFKQAINYELI